MGPVATKKKPKKNHQRTSLRLGSDVHHRTLPLIRAIGWKSRPEALKREGTAPRKDVPLLSRGVGRPKDGSRQTRRDLLGRDAVQGSLVIITHLLPDARQILDDLDPKLLQLRLGPDTAELEDLRGVEGAAGDDDFPFGKHLRDWSFGAGDVLGIGFVEGCALHELDADGARLGG